MKKRLDNNGGFTLVELIIAIAILALLMTAICGLMGVQVVSFKKTKADITVQNTAQETYDNMTDAIMQAKSITIEGYTLDAGQEITFDPTKIGETVNGLNFTSKIYVKDGAYNNLTKSLSEAELLKYGYFSSLKKVDADGNTTYTDLYVKKMVITYSVPLDEDMVPQSILSGTDLTNVTTDLCTATYEFDGKNMYLQKEYQYMTEMNDVYTASGDKSGQLYTASLNYVNATGAPDASGVTTTIPITGVIVNVDAENNSIGINFMFADKSMSYNTIGMVNVRNSYVLNDFEEVIIENSEESESTDEDSDSESDEDSEGSSEDTAEDDTN